MDQNVGPLSFSREREVVRREGFEYCALSHDDFGGSCPWCLSIDAQHKFPRHVFPRVSNRATFVHLLQSPYCSQRKGCDLPCVSGGQGRWTRLVTNLTRYMSPWQFWPKWEMGSLRTFKRLGAHAHREVKSPRDSQKARGGRSDPRASYPNPATSGRGGKITHRHLYRPAKESMSPRLRRLVNDQCGSEAKTLAEVMVQRVVELRSRTGKRIEEGCGPRLFCADLEKASAPSGGASCLV